MRKLYLFGTMIALPLLAEAQSAIDAYRFSQPDMKGTARFMSMGGAFGALGGDLSAISSNPAGLGVYRRSEIGISMDFDFQSATSETQGYKNKQNQTKFPLSNVGGVVSFNLYNKVMPNINLAFTYNRAASFNARYSGSVPKLYNSLTNYIAGATNNEGATVADLQSTDTFDAYNPNDGGYAAPWLSILGYDSYFITPTGDNDQPDWIGQWNSQTSGTGVFDVVTTGGADEYNIAIGGNIANKVFWGLDFGIVDLDYNMTAVWGEKLANATVDNTSGIANTSADWMMTNYYSASGTGYNVKLGLIYRPIQELRLGLSFATPTWYSINESYLARTNFNYPDVNLPDMQQNSAVTNGGRWGTNSYNFRTPWKLAVSAAGVIGRNLIVSADFEWQKFNKMRFYDGGGSFYDYGYDDDYYPDWGWGDPWYAPAQGHAKASPKAYSNDPWYATNHDIEDYYKSTTTIRVGAEYRITPRFSVRAGYAHVSSPVKTEAKDGSMLIYTSGTMTNYKLDNSTDYITCGLGYNFNNFYVDAAFVHKRMGSEYHAYTPDPANPQIPSPTSKLSLINNQLVVSAGFKF
ncbi:MAG: outer membrane protein transport protein [Muribaculum sp.]|nr:outer membrane protein transport protein [Muribaculum sp.]